MNLANQDVFNIHEAGDVTHEELPSEALFLGDHGELPMETRRVFVQLLVGPSLEGRRHTNLWPILERDESVIRRRLGDLFLDLVIDRDAQIAFIRQADSGDVYAPKMLRRVQLSFIDSMLLLYLRQRLLQAESHGDRAVVSMQEIEESLALYEHKANSDRAGFSKRIRASIEKTKKYSILRKIKGSDDRFEVSPTLKLLFSAEKVQALSELFQRMGDGETDIESCLLQQHDDEESQ